jgi:hypothetical protein
LLSRSACRSCWCCGAPVVGGDLRQDTQFGRMAVDVVRRTDLSLDELFAAVEELRRHKADAEATEASILDCANALRRYAQEAAMSTVRHAGEGGGAGRRSSGSGGFIEHGQS